GKRISADAVPSGLAMLDVDHVENPREWFEALQRETIIENHIFLVAITASGKGLRIIGARAQGETIEAAQMRMAQALGIEEYDAVTKDLARASYVVPRDYILWMDTTELFAEREWKDILPPPAEQTEEHETETYRGLPYADIVEEMLVQTGNAGGAVQGERNTVYFSLANYMRYICDFNKELLMRILPDFGLSEQERQAAIVSALGRPRRDQIPVILQAAIATVEREQEAKNNEPKLPKASEMRLPKLPKLLRILCGKLPSSYRPAMIVASLPVLGTLATRIRFNYLDMQEQSLSFFSCITAPAASGKSFIRKPIDLLLTPINEQDAIEREKEQNYKEALRSAKNSKCQPEDPHACPRNNGVSVSVAKLLQLLTYAEGKHLIGIGEEMDTLVKSERAGVWSQKSDIYRLAFDNAEYGQAYMSETSFNAHIRVYYNLLLTGTPNSMTRFFKDLENGLATRVCFAQLPDTSFAEIPVFAPYDEEEKEEIIRWARRLDAEQGTIECEGVSRAIATWLEEKRQQAIDADNHAMDTLRRRAAVIGFRAGMLCYLLEDRKETKLVASFAEWVAEYVFRNQMELWGEQMERELTQAMDSQSERGSATSLLGLLPAEFTTAELIKLRTKKGQSVKLMAIKTLLARWKKSGRIARIAEGQWKQLK
ncbi:MAG: DUF3987 domain-containing protein, partial [Paludibacteraceae bacterium]|nr:DUF3987 domain-containing protein [Paludibacteraceae bacterium]